MVDDHRGRRLKPRRRRTSHLHADAGLSSRLSTRLRRSRSRCLRGTDFCSLAPCGRVINRPDQSLPPFFDDVHRQLGGTSLQGRQPPHRESTRATTARLVGRGCSARRCRFPCAGACRRRTAVRWRRLIRAPRGAARNARLPFAARGLCVRHAGLGSGAITLAGTDAQNRAISVRSPKAENRRLRAFGARRRLGCRRALDHRREDGRWLAAQWREDLDQQRWHRRLFTACLPRLSRTPGRAASARSLLIPALRARR